MEQLSDDDNDNHNDDDYDDEMSFSRKLECLYLGRETDSAK